MWMMVCVRVLVTLADLDAVPFVGPFAAAVSRDGFATDEPRAVFEVTRRMITALIGDVVKESRVRLGALEPASPDDIRAGGGAVVAFSAQMSAEIETLRAFLFERVYRHPRVTRIMGDAQGIVGDLFQHYAGPGGAAALPDAWQAARTGLTPRQQARLVADYLAGQTDRYALAEHRRLFAQTPELR